MTLDEAKQYIAGRIDNNDYISISKFYRQLNAKNNEQREMLDNMADEMEEYGGIVQSLLKRAKDPNEAARLSFAIKQSAGLNDASAYGEQYSKYLNNTLDKHNYWAVYSGKEGARINKVEFMLAPEYYDEFVEKSGLNFSHFDKDNTSAPYIENCTTSGAGDYIKFGGSQYVKLTVPVEAYGDVNTFNKINSTLNDMRSLPFKLLNLEEGGRRCYYKCYDDKGQEVESGNGIPQSHKKALSLSKPAMDMLEGLTESLYDLNGVFDIQTTGYACSAQQEVMNARSRGEMDDSHANALLNDIKTVYNNKILTDGLGSYKVYATEENPKTMNFEEVKDSEKKTNLVNILRTAMDKNRVTYVAADAGGKAGTYITITGNPDEKGGERGGYSGARYMFVEGFMADEAKKVLNNDIKLKSKKLYYDHLTFGHDYYTPDGGKITDISNKGGVYVKGNYKKVLSSDEVINEIKKSSLIKDAAKVIKQDYGYQTLRNNPEIRQSDDFRNSVTEYATRLYTYLNNVTDPNAFQKPYVQNEINGIISNIIDYIYNYK